MIFGFSKQKLQSVSKIKTQVSNSMITQVTLKSFSLRYLSKRVEIPIPGLPVLRQYFFIFDFKAHYISNKIAVTISSDKHHKSVANRPLNCKIIKWQNNISQMYIYKCIYLYTYTLNSWPWKAYAKKSKLMCTIWIIYTGDKYRVCLIENNKKTNSWNTNRVSWNGRWTKSQICCMHIFRHFCLSIFCW
jgi:hypothetical protein